LQMSFQHPVQKVLVTIDARPSATDALWSNFADSLLRD
jgi:hypothetical protein